VSRKASIAEKQQAQEARQMLDAHLRLGGEIDLYTNQTNADSHGIYMLPFHVLVGVVTRDVPSGQCTMRVDDGFGFVSGKVWTVYSHTLENLLRSIHARLLIDMASARPGYKGDPELHAAVRAARTKYLR